MRFHSTVLITDNIQVMKDFYNEAMELSIEFDFGGSVIFDCGLSIWQLKEDYPLSKTQWNKERNKRNEGMELCFETDDFEEDSERIKNRGVKLVHDIIEEQWGQLTVRFSDPDGNLVELGESMPCFSRRLFKTGMSIDEVAEKTGIPKETIKMYLE